MRYKLVILAILLCSSLSGCADFFAGQNPDEYNPELEALARRRIIQRKVNEVIFRGGDLYIDGIKMPAPLQSLRY